MASINFIFNFSAHSFDLSDSQTETKVNPNPTIINKIEKKIYREK